MLFNSYIFLLVFLPVTFLLFRLFQVCRWSTLAKGWLVASSLCFYGYFKPDYLPIIIISILLNYSIGRGMLANQPRRGLRTLLLTIGCCLNVGILVYYKYSGFLLNNLNLVFSTSYNFPFLEDLVLPLGISFYTFQQLSYVIDCYSAKCQKYSLLEYSLFVTFFPQLIAGPIVLPSEMLPQFNEAGKSHFSLENFSEGGFMLVCGLAKKCFLADTLAIIADVGFATDIPLRLADAWLISLSYTLQLYFDFSGYCDMAMGLARMFNIELPMNFNSPYKSTDFQDFWRRWHITLGRFMMIYLYIPMGGNRKGGFRTSFNLFCVFLISGLWHGAGWLFLIWGGLHGLSIIIHRFWRKLMDKRYHAFKIPRRVAVAITFVCVNILWVFFRAPDLLRACRLLKYMGGVYSWKLNISRPFTRVLESAGNFSKECLVWTVIICLAIIFVLPNTQQMLQRLKNHRWIMAILTGVFGWLGFICISRMSPFLYFNF
ncbi:MAG: MBOAT family O-acyltransferase [Lentisphaeria bacterium]